MAGDNKNAKYNRKRDSAQNKAYKASFRLARNKARRIATQERREKAHRAKVARWLYCKTGATLHPFASCGDMRAHVRMAARSA